MQYKKEVWCGIEKILPPSQPLQFNEHKQDYIAVIKSNNTNHIFTDQQFDGLISEHCQQKQSEVKEEFVTEHLEPPVIEELESVIMPNLPNQEDIDLLSSDTWKWNGLPGNEFCKLINDTYNEIVKIYSSFHLETMRKHLNSRVNILVRAI